MKYSIFPVIVGLSFIPQWALAQEGPQLQFSGSLKFGWQKSERDLSGPPPVVEHGGHFDIDVGGLLYGSFDNGLSYGLQFWSPVVDNEVEPTTGGGDSSNAVDRDAGLAGYISGNGWQFSVGQMDDAYRAALGNIDIGETIGDLPAETLLDMGSNEGFLRYTGGPSLRFDATYADFTLYSSISDAKLELPGSSSSSGPIELDKPVFAVGLRWEKETDWGKIFAATAFQSSDYLGDDASFRGITAGLEAGGFTVKVSNSEGPVSYDNRVTDRLAVYRGASVEYKIDGWSIGANYGRQIGVSNINGVGRGIWVSKQLPNDLSVSASWSHTHFDDSTALSPIDRDAMSIGFIKKF